MNASRWVGRSRRWLLGLVVAAGLAASALGLPRVVEHLVNAQTEIPALAGPQGDLGGGGGG